MAQAHTQPERLSMALYSSRRGGETQGGIVKSKEQKSKESSVQSRAYRIINCTKLVKQTIKE